MRRRILQCTVLAVATGLGLLGAEWLWRRLVQAQYERQRAAFAEPLFTLVDGPELYTLRADLDFVHTIADPAGGPPTTVHYHTQPDGLRRHDIWPPPTDPTLPRVLFLGDSYTFGTAVGDADTLPQQTQRELAAQGVRAFVINAGVPGHNSAQQLARLPELLQRFHPQHVVLGFVMNDAEPPTYAPIPPATRHAASLSWLWEDGKPLWNALGAQLVDDRPLWQPHLPEYDFDYRRSWAAGAEKGRNCLAALAAMHTTCRTAGAEFTIAVLPDFTRAFDDTYPFHAIHAQVAELGQRVSFRSIDTFAGLRGADSTALRVPGDGHPNPEGQRRLAIQIASVLAERLRG